MKESRHKRDTSLTAIQICTDFSSEFLDAYPRPKAPTSETAAPIRSILKKSPTSNRTAEVESEPTRRVIDRFTSSSSVSSPPHTSPTCSQSVLPPRADCEETSRLPAVSHLYCSAKTRYSPRACDETESDDAEEEMQMEQTTLKREVGRVVDTIKRELRDAERIRAEARSQLLRDILAAVDEMKNPPKDRDQSLVVLESSYESGSETDRVSSCNNHSSLQLALETYSSSPQQLADLRSLVDCCGTPRLALLVRKNRVDGMYQQCASGWSKLYGGKDAPSVVAPGMVKIGFEACGRELKPLSTKQLWKVDAFTL